MNAAQKAEETLRLHDTLEEMQVLLRSTLPRARPGPPHHASSERQKPGNPPLRNKEQNDWQGNIFAALVLHIETQIILACAHFSKSSCSCRSLTAALLKHLLLAGKNAGTEACGTARQGIRSSRVTMGPSWPWRDSLLRPAAVVATSSKQKVNHESNQGTTNSISCSLQTCLASGMC